MSSSKSIELVAYYTKGDISGKDLVGGAPQGDFIALFDSYEEKVPRKDKETKKDILATIYHNIILVDKKIAHLVTGAVWHNYIRPFYPGEDKDPLNIYWKGFNVKALVTRYNEITESTAIFHDKDDYGFVQIDEDFPFPEVLVGILRFSCPQGSICNFAVPRTQRTSTWGKYQSVTVKDSVKGSSADDKRTKTKKVNKFKKADRAPVEESISGKKRTKKIKKFIVDDEGFTSISVTVIPARSVSPNDDVDHKTDETDEDNHDGEYDDVIVYDKPVIKQRPWGSREEVDTE